MSLRLRLPCRTVFVLCLTTALVVSTPPAGAAEDSPLAQVQVAGTTLHLEPAVPAVAFRLTVVGPAGQVLERTFEGDGVIAVDLAGLAGEGAALDGSWTWELRRVVATERRAPEAGDSVITRRAQITGPLVQAGTLRIVDGLLHAPTTNPETAGVETKQSISDSLCVGTSCGAETFGEDTLRLKENNLRVHFDDNSTSTGFPSRSWRILINDEFENGSNYFAIQDVDAATVPIRFEGGLTANSLRLTNSGLGLGTASPVLDLHVATGDTPGLRLEQTTASGFGAQTWDIAGNETSFFVRDATNGSTLPFRIRPGAASNRLVVDTDGQIGVGVLSPAEALHVQGSTGATKLLVEETSGTTNGRQMFELRNNGNVNFILVNTSGNTWQMIADTTGPFPGYSLSRQGSGVREMRVDNNGNLFTSGSINPASSRAIKENFAELDPADVLGKLTALPVTSWNYIRDDDTLRHIGPMAEDFYAAFGVGGDDSHISVTDAFGVTVAALQGLQQEKDREIAELRRTVEELRQGLNELEERTRNAAH